MRCSNCGKDVPFTGKVCPWCHADKSEDQVYYATAMVVGMPLGLILAVVGGTVIDPCWGWIGGFAIGIFVGISAGLVAQDAHKKKRATSIRRSNPENPGTMSRKEEAQCSRCGNPILPVAKFCSSCGLMREKNHAEETTSDPAQSLKRFNARLRKNSFLFKVSREFSILRVLTFVSLAFVGMILLVIAIIAFGHGK